MIKVPDIGIGSRYHGSFRDEEGFDPTRDDWSRHGEGKGSKPDGVGYLDEDKEHDVPSWYEPESEVDDEDDRPLHRAA